MVVQTIPEVLLLLAVISDIGRGVASELEEAITVLYHRHNSLK
jgi:hypothetical protein